MSAKYAIVVVGYNRIESILRSVESIKAAYYGQDEVDLIISLDNCGDDHVLNAANDVEWPYGQKKVRHLNERYGLRKHMLSCGEFLNDYEAIAMIEDDIIVAKGFYQYMKQAVKRFENDNDIAGISLYSFEWNPNYNAPFYPYKTKWSNFFMQYAQSWGQIWMRRSFKEFLAWYEKNENRFKEEYDGSIPPAVYGWSESSWLKYHILYCVENNKYFVYPYDSYSTNFTEPGEHYIANLTRFQVSLQNSVVNEFDFASLNDGIKYDVFFEIEGDILENVYKKLSEELSIDPVSFEDNVTVDIYGNKPIPKDKKYFLSSQILDKKVLKSFGLSMRPQEDNIIHGVKGDNVFFYDLAVEEKNPKKKSHQIDEKWNYYNREKFVMLDEAIPVGGRKLGNMIRSLFVKL